MKKLALLAALVLVLAGPVFAQTQTTVTGTVVSSTADRLVVRTATGDVSFNLAGSQRPASFTTGNYVTVWYNPTMVNNSYSVTRVEADDADLKWDNIKVVTGTVVSFSEDDLVLKTANGNLTFDLDKNTPRPASIMANNRLTVYYDADDKIEDNMDARKVVMAPAIAQAQVITPPPVQTSQTTTTTPTPNQNQTQTQNRTYDTNTTNDRNTRTDVDRYPDTASPMPLVLAASLLALAGALTLRVTRRS